MNRPRALMVDDSESLRYAFRRIIELHSECEVVGEAANGRAAVTAAEMLRPDVIILDISMPLMDGFEAARHILGDCPKRMSFS